MTFIMFFLQVHLLLLAMVWAKLLRPWLRLYRGALVEDSRWPQCVVIYKSVTNCSISSPVSITCTSVRTLVKKSPDTSEVNAMLDKQDNPKIQLFGLENELMAVLTKHQAKAQADKRGLRLVEVDGTAKPYPVYQLMTGKDLHKQQMEQRQSKKGKVTEKSFRLATKISQHDLDIKLKQMEQNLVKGNRVKLIVYMTKSSSPQVWAWSMCLMGSVWDFVFLCTEISHVSSHDYLGKPPSSTMAKVV